MKTVRFIALGPSAVETPKFEEGVEVWGIQYTWQHFRLTRAFVMDDREWIVAKNHSFDSPIDVAGDMRKAKVPIYVAKKWPDVENTIEYPIEEIKKAFPVHYFMNSMAYMFALAIYEGFGRIETYGIDLRYFTDLGGEHDYNHNWLDETHCAAFWAGIAIGRGIDVVTTKRSSLMKPVFPDDPSLYGYVVSPKIQEQRRSILEKRKKVELSGEQKVSVFRPPPGTDLKEFMKQASVGAVQPIAVTNARTWNENTEQTKNMDGQPTT